MTEQSSGLRVVVASVVVVGSSVVVVVGSGVVVVVGSSVVVVGSGVVVVVGFCVVVLAPVGFHSNVQSLTHPWSGRFDSQIVHVSPVHLSVRSAVHVSNNSRLPRHVSQSYDK